MIPMFCDACGLCDGLGGWCYEFLQLTKPISQVLLYHCVSMGEKQNNNNKAKQRGETKQEFWWGKSYFRSKQKESKMSITVISAERTDTPI